MGGIGKNGRDPYFISTLETTSCNYVSTFLNVVLVVCRMYRFLPLTTSRGVHGYSQGRKLGVLSKDFGDAAESLPLL